MLLNALICDDEINCCKEIEIYLTKYCSEHKIPLTYDCFTDSAEVDKIETKYDIAFLDIELNGNSGIELAKKLKERNKRIIIFFITNYQKYVDDAMNLYALRFLEKPLDYTRFYGGLDRAIELINEDVVEVPLSKDDRIIILPASDIMYIETLNHKTEVVTVSEAHQSKNLMDSWDRTLNHKSFYRVHKSFILNLDYIKEYQRKEVIMKNGKLVPISYRNQAVFRKVFYEYLKRRK